MLLATKKSFGSFAYGFEAQRIGFIVSDKKLAGCTEIAAGGAR